MKKRFFVEILKEICVEEGFKLDIYSHEWLCKITDPKTGKFTWTVGYNFDLNSGVSHLMINDKVNTSVVLNENGVPVVMHYPLISDYYRKYLEIGTGWMQDVVEILEETNLPVVVKPADGTQGEQVYLCDKHEDVNNIVEQIMDRRLLTISKYYNSKYEYRFYVLDGDILFAYRKVKLVGSWKHNLSQGATPELLPNELLDNKFADLKSLVLEGFRALGMRLGAIDVLETEEGYKILEVNSGIAMDKFAATSEEYKKVAKVATRKMLLSSLISK